MRSGISAKRITIKTTEHAATDTAKKTVNIGGVKESWNNPLPAKHVVFGAVGLAGEVRAVQRGQERLREAAKLGFTHAIVPKANKPRQKIEGLEVLAVERVEQAVEYCRG